MLWPCRVDMLLYQVMGPLADGLMCSKHLSKGQSVMSSILLLTHLSQEISRQTMVNAKACSLLSTGEVTVLTIG